MFESKVGYVRKWWKSILKVNHLEFSSGTISFPSAVGGRGGEGGASTHFTAKKWQKLKSPL
jgi:hypothetical protein